MRRFLIAASALALCATSALAQAPLKYNPCAAGGTDESADKGSDRIRVNVSSMIVVVHKGPDHDQGIPRGFTDLDHPAPFTCRNPAGCLVSALTVVNVQGSAMGCTFVDGISMHPAQMAAPMNLSSKKVPAGRHVVQTKALAFEGDAVLHSWEVQYTFYDR